MLQPRSLMALAVLLALGGCTTQTGATDSSTGFSGDKRVVANVVEDFESAASKGDQGRICRDLLARALVTRLAQRGGTCDKAVDAALKDTDTFALTVKTVRIEGARATATVDSDIGDKNRRQSLTLTRQGPSWRISGFGA